MSRRERVYEVQSTYKVTGTSYIVARSAAEAARIGTDGYPSGHMPQFDFSEAWGETKMTARSADGDYVSQVQVPDSAYVISTGSHSDAHCFEHVKWRGFCGDIECECSCHHSTEVDQ